PAPAGRRPAWPTTRRRSARHRPAAAARPRRWPARGLGRGCRCESRSRCRRTALQPARSRWLPAWWRGRSRSWSHVRPGEFGTLKHESLPEPKTVKNRIHWDVTVPGVAPLVGAGATVLREPGGDIRWHVLADPEGNEFCVHRVTTAASPCAGHP